MSAKPLGLIKIVSGRSLAKKELDPAIGNKARSSSAESKGKISLKNIIVRKSRENLFPREKNLFRQRVACNKTTKLKKLDLNIKEVNNAFYRRLNEIEPKLSDFENTVPVPKDLISPVKIRN
jgi:hypothetical protein